MREGEGVAGSKAMPPHVLERTYAKGVSCHRTCPALRSLCVTLHGWSGVMHGGNVTHTFVSHALDTLWPHTLRHTGAMPRHRDCTALERSAQGQWRQPGEVRERAERSARGGRALRADDWADAGECGSHGGGMSRECAWAHGERAAWGVASGPRGLRLVANF